MKMNICKDEKGFSLIELIVVVLIIAIVAVALAPQVVKWVENSRISSDIQTLSDLENICKLAIADAKAYEKVRNGSYELIISKTSSGLQYDYLPTEVDFDTDDFWQSFLRTGGYSSKQDFEHNVEVKSNSTNGDPAAIHVYVWVGGFTFGKLENVVSDTIEIPTGFSGSAHEIPSEG